jgi:DNA adenine methylase
MTIVPHPIPYQGSKRIIARHILHWFPSDVERLIEPFAGSAAVSLAAAVFGKAENFVLNDINEPLIELWNQIVRNPSQISAAYGRLWDAQQGREREYYDFVRDRFNRTHRPNYLLYLLARCVKAAVRYNSKGEFNQSPDNRRKGMRPSTMRAQIFGASSLLKSKVTFSSLDYRRIIETASINDLVYMDPPYQGVCGERDRRYSQVLAYEAFIESLEELNRKDVSFIVSYDGRTGKKSFGKTLPAGVQTTHIEIKVGKSSQATLLGRDEDTFESLYLSRALVARIGKLKVQEQTALFDHGVEKTISLQIPQALAAS